MGQPLTGSACGIVEAARQVACGVQGGRADEPMCASILFDLRQNE